jgi:hypothetical protein
VFKHMQRLGVDAIGHKSRSNSMAGNVAKNHAQKFIALRQDYAEVAANSTGGAVIGLNREFVPNQAARRE